MIRLNLDINKNWQFMRETIVGGNAPAAIDYDDSAWETIMLPHTPKLEPEIVNDQWEGICWYRLRFVAVAEWNGKSVKIEIGAAMQQCAVYLNGQYLFTHFGGYQRFIFDIGDSLAYDAENLLALRLDNRPSGDMTPGKPLKNLDFCYYGGIYRECRILVREAIHISDPLEVSIPAGGGAFVRTVSVNQKYARIKVNVHALHHAPQALRFQLDQAADNNNPCSIHTVIQDKSGQIVADQYSPVINLRLNTDWIFCQEINIPNPKLWHPDHPELYQAEITLSHNGIPVDCTAVRFGIRMINFTGERGFEINGQRLKIIGTNRHQEYPYVGNAVPPAAQRRDAVIIKQAGYNLVRLSHYNQHPAFINACDELGICVIAAIPGWQTYHLNDHFTENLFRDCRYLVRENRNHPSMVLWEVCLNEAYPPSWLNEQCHRVAHEEYPGNDCFTCGDSFGLYEGWDVLFYRKNLNTDKPVLLREYGDWAFGGNNSTSRQRRRDGEYAMLQQAWNFQWTYNLLEKTKGFCGGCNWAVFDYNRGYHHDIERSGDTDIFRVPRYKYFFYMSQRNPNIYKPMVYIASDWTERQSPAKVVIFSNCEEVELQLNGKTIAVKRPDDEPDTPYNPAGGNTTLETAILSNVDSSGGNPYDGGNCSHLPHPPFTFKNIPYENGELRAFGRISGIIKAEHKVLTHEAPIGLEIVFKTENVPLSVAGDLMFVEARLVDCNGTVVPDNQQKVSAMVDGPADIVGPAVRIFEAGIASFLLKTKYDAKRIKIFCTAGNFNAENQIMPMSNIYPFFTVMAIPDKKTRTLIKAPISCEQTEDIVLV